MRIVKQHRRTAVAVGALTTALAVSVASLVVAQVPSTDDTIASRVTDSAFLNGSQAVIPEQTLDPATICDATDGACELWAKAGSITVAGVAGTVTVWGYALGADQPALVPGPVILADKGEIVTVTVHNTGLPADAGDLGFTARSMSTVPTTLLAGGATGSYTFTAARAGTSVYGASADSPSGNRQIAMGLAGTLVVRPTNCPASSAGCAYGDPLTLGDGSALGFSAGTDVFDGEALIATNELDLNLNNATDPAAFDMTTYHPTVHLINGKAFPDTQVIDGFAGANLLVRYANLGLADHSMGLVGAHQRTIGRDGLALPHGSDDVTVPLNVGQTADVMVTIPLDAKAGFRYALADEARQPGAQAADPAMTFLTVWGDPAAPGQPFGEVTIADADADSNGVTALPYTYTIPSSSPAVTGARWSVDAPGVSTTAFGSTFPGTYNATIPPAVLGSLANGAHVLWVEWTNDGANWSVVGAAFTVDRAGPAMTPVDVDPIYTNGTQDVTLAATADSSLTGSGTVEAALWAVGPSCAYGSGQPMSSNGPAPVVALSHTIPAALVDTLAPGSHSVWVQGQDNHGMWSNTGDGTTPACGQGTLVVDKTAPAVSAADVSPNDNDGTMAFPTLDSYLPVVRITAHVSDPNIGIEPGSGIAQVEGFIDDGLQPLPLTPAMYDTGFLFTPVDGNFDSAEEDVYADIPLASVATLTPGDHSIWIHGQDRAGNWGTVDVAATTLRTVNTAPQVTDVFVDGTDVTITGTANGTGVTIAAYEYTAGANAPVVVNIAPLDQAPVINVTLNGITLGAEENIGVRIQDSTGQWSAQRFGKPIVASLALTKIANVPNPNRQRLQGTVLAAAGGTVDGIEWSTGAAPAAPGTSVNWVPLAGTSFNIVRNSGFVTPPGTVWVRAHDPSGAWGPAVSVNVP